MSGDEISERFIVGIESFLSLGSAFLSKATGSHIPPLSTPPICHLYGSDTPTTEFFLETSINEEDDVCVASDWLGKMCRIPLSCLNAQLRARCTSLVSSCRTDLFSHSSLVSVSSDSWFSFLVSLVIGTVGAKISRARREIETTSGDIFASISTADPLCLVSMVCMAYIVTPTVDMEEQ